MGDHAVEVVVLRQPLGRGLRAALVDAGHVVDLVAHQREEVDNAFRRHAELLDHAITISAASAHGVDQGDAGLHQLREVLVAGGDDDVEARFRAGFGQGADHVVGLDAGHAQQRDAQRLDDLDHGLALRTQFVGHRWPVGLVLGIEFVAEGRAGGVQHEGQVVGGFLQRAAQHVDHAEQRASGLAGAVGKRRQCVEGAIEVARSIDQYQAGHPELLQSETIADDAIVSAADDAWKSIVKSRGFRNQRAGEQP